MEIYTLRFFWPDGVTPECPDPFNIQAKDHASAKLAADELYRGQVFRTRPDGYRLFNQAGDMIQQMEVWR